MIRDFFFLINFFLNFIIPYWIEWKSGFMICLDLLSIKLSLFNDIDHEFDVLILVDSSYLLCLFFNQFFCSISSFNIKLIENWASQFVLVNFLLSYFDSIIALTTKTIDRFGLVRQISWLVLVKFLDVHHWWTSNQLIHLVTINDWLVHAVF